MVVGSKEETSIKDGRVRVCGKGDGLGHECPEVAVGKALIPTRNLGTPSSGPKGGVLHAPQKNSTNRKRMESFACFKRGVNLYLQISLHKEKGGIKRRGLNGCRPWGEKYMDRGLFKAWGNA